MKTTLMNQLTVVFNEDDQKRNSTSESEDEDVIPPTPPFPLAKRKRANQYVTSVVNTKSKVFFFMEKHLIVSYNNH